MVDDGLKRVCASAGFLRSKRLGWRLVASSRRKIGKVGFSANPFQPDRGVQQAKVALVLRSYFDVRSGS